MHKIKREMSKKMHESLELLDYFLKAEQKKESIAKKAQEKRAFAKIFNAIAEKAEQIAQDFDISL